MRPRRCYFCKQPYRRRDLVEIWVDITKPADQGGKLIVKAGAGCGCSSVARLLEAVAHRAPKAASSYMRRGRRAA